MDDQSTSHAKFLILDHLIVVCQSRKKLLIHVGNETKGIVEGMAANADVSMETLEVDQDHLHWLVQSEPRISPLAIVRKVTQESTVQRWKMHEKALKRHCWQERTFWSDGYFCCTIGNASQETIRHCIESQG
jgi:putative transposase